MVPKRAAFDFDSEVYHRGSGTHRFEYDTASTPPTMAAVSALSSVLDASPTSMEPLANTVDTDALDALVYDSGAVGGVVEVSWTQAGHDVTVSSDGVVEVSPARDDHPGSPVER